MLQKHHTVTLLFGQRLVIFIVNAYYLIQILFQNNSTLAEKFFYLAILPELLGKWFTRDHTALPTVMLHDDSDEEEDNGSWCYCQEAKGGDMTGCENVSCSIKWFHKVCLRIKQRKDPKGKWLCPSCYAVQNPPK